MKQTGKKWVVTGGTGFIGSRLVARLIGAGHDVTVFSRGGGTPASEGQARVVSWTPERPGPWMKEIDGCFAVIHLAGAGVLDSRWTDARKAEIISSRVETTRLVSQAMVEAKSRPEVLVSASAVGIYGMRKDDEVQDERSPLASDFLADVCIRWEKAADVARDEGLRVAHPRIGIVLGRGGGVLGQMMPPFTAFVGGPIGDGEQWVSWVHLEDLLNALVYPTERTSLVGAYNVTAPEPVTMNDLAATLGREMRRPSVMRVPAAALRLAWGERAEAVLTGQRVLPRRLQAEEFQFAHPTLAPAIRNLLAAR